MDLVHTWGSYGWGELPWGSSLYERSIDESTTATDAVAATALLSGNVQETVAASDAISAAAVLNSAVQDSASGADTLLAVSVYISSLLEAASAQETVAARFQPSCLVSETADIQAQVLGGGDFSAHIQENTVAEDVLTFGNSTYNIGILEDVAAEDRNSTNTVFNSAVAASATASDSASRRLLWEPINTGVDEDWTLINTNS